MVIGIGERREQKRDGVHKRKNRGIGESEREAGVERERSRLSIKKVDP